MFYSFAWISTLFPSLVQARWLLQCFTICSEPFPQLLMVSRPVWQQIVLLIPSQSQDRGEVHLQSYVELTADITVSCVVNFIIILKCRIYIQLLHYKFFADITGAQHRGGVNFTNVVCAAFTVVAPKSAKQHSQLDCFLSIWDLWA